MYTSVRSPCQTAQDSQERIPEYPHPAPQHARQSPAPAAYGQYLAGRPDDETYLPDHIGNRTLLPGYKRAVPPDVQPGTFPPDDAVQHVSSVISEKYHVHRLKFILRTGVQHHLVPPVTQ